MDRQSRVRLFLVSFAALFFEILVIRWAASEIRIFGYFKNLVLMGAFVGLGLGCATGGQSAKGASGKDDREMMISIFPYLMLVLVASLATAAYTGLKGVNFILSTDVFFWMARSDVISSLTGLAVNAGWLMAVFLIIVSAFDSLGQLLGKELSRHDSLRAYTANLSGSLAGVLAFSLLSYARTSPFVWLAVGFASLVPFFRKVPQIVAMCLCVVIAYCFAPNSIWSPYYRIECKPNMWGPAGKEYQIGTHIIVNQGSFQRTINLSDAFLKLHPDLKEAPDYVTYNIPYDAKPDAKNVLVLGAGSGNDVAAALRHGAAHVDAVEIDPVIQDLGRTIHPEKPFADARVSLYVNDARKFISTTTNKYDLIVFGFVDSSVSFSTLSSIRLDNFLYTTESLKAVQSCLAPDGIAVLSFAAGPPWLRARLFQMVESVSPDKPLALRSSFSNANSIIILFGPGLKPKFEELKQRFAKLIIPLSELSEPVPLCTDDWPFLYQKAKALTLAYGWMLVLLILIAGFLTVSRFRLQASSFVSNLQFFFLGAGFLLLETRAMLVIAVLFGSTWMVNSIVIALILLMAMCANLLVEKLQKIPFYVGYGGLFASLILLYLLPLSNLTGGDPALTILKAAVIVGLPFAFAGIVFSSAFAKSKKPDEALGVNILGALVGGCTEYLSTIIGTRDLVLLALMYYVLSTVPAILPIFKKK